MKKSLHAAIMLFFLLCVSDVSFATNRDLVLGIPLFFNDAPVTRGFVSLLNRFLRPDDILFVRGQPKNVQLLKNIRNGKVAVIRQSLPDLKRDLEFLLSQKIKVNYLCYNPEVWKSSHTPREEKEDPLSAVIKARKIAEEHGLGLIVVTDTMKTLPSYGAEMAGYADIFGIQLQRWQRLEESLFREQASKAIAKIKKADPDIRIMAQLSLNPPFHRSRAGKTYGPAIPPDIHARIKSIESMIDGIGFLLFTQDGGIDRFFELLKKFRPEIK